MPVLSTDEATVKLATVVENTKPSVLAEVYSELYPELPTPISPQAAELAKHIRNGLEAEELVDLWNVLFPEHRNVHYNQETKFIQYNEEIAEFVD